MLARVTPQHAGTGAGVLTTTAQIGNAIGVALMGILFYQQLVSQPHDSGYARALEVSLVYLMATGVLVALLVQLLPRQAKA